MRLLFMLFMGLGMPIHAQTDLNTLLQAVSGKWYARVIAKNSAKFTAKHVLTININKYSEYEMTKRKLDNPHHLVTGVFSIDVFPKRKPGGDCKLPEEFHHPFTGIVVGEKIIFQMETRKSNLYMNFVLKVRRGEIDLKNGVKKGVLELNLTSFDIFKGYMKKGKLTFTRDKSLPKS